MLYLEAGGGKEKTDGKGKEEDGFELIHINEEPNYKTNTLINDTNIIFLSPNISHTDHNLSIKDIIFFLQLIALRRKTTIIIE